ncbi:hypothetical protein [Sulfuracidifex metallicus]|uniref:Uncharacterized protein n=1 Tax=Sulfuracidifex metallicus DSM 6482 = JCM 9184 TaxID=523847 RepID=A0A6A9QKR8_SULME|nr:hypothetical protein [Sulfuracidifex metallicus]MUN28719.1 hypothetical protein [Sulfuracidifex metallicus DSM 6482 = JCM 9184]WOE50760.1 hypothetical protein RQ359_002329 [Sulfuracidifex metallicus DSM 6482 = JCM 9184]
MAGAGIFHCSTSYKDILSSFKVAKSLYPDFTVNVLDLNNVDDRMRAVDIDPDVADLQGYCVTIEVPEKLY